MPIVLNDPNFSLQRGYVDIWFVNLTDLDFKPAFYYALLDEAERNIAANLKFQALRTAYIHGHGLVRIILGRYLQILPATLNIKRTLYGKPFLADYPLLSFNLSHSGSKWMLAVTESVPVGVDIETIKPRTQTTGLVARCFAPEEQAYWRLLPEAEQLPRFFELWTRKEAFVKAVGRGIALGLDECVIDPYQVGRFLRVPAMAGVAEDWWMTHWSLDQTCCAAVVAKSPGLEVRFFTVDEQMLSD